jgi:hypothetical protein
MVFKRHKEAEVSGLIGKTRNCLCLDTKVLTHGVNLHHICTVDAERNMLLVGAVCSVE